MKLRTLIFAAFAALTVTGPAVAAEFKIDCGKRGITVVYEPEINPLDGDILSGLEPVVVAAYCNDQGRIKIVLDGNWYGAPDAELVDIGNVKKMIQILDDAGIKGRVQTASN